MKKLFLFAVTAACTLFLGVGIGHAQDGVPEIRPLEMWVCSYRDGKDQGDMDNVFEDFVEATEGDAYAGYRLTPSYVSGDQAFDFIYLGVWESGSMMGRDLTDYAVKGADVDEAWDEVVDCPASLMYGSIRIQQNDGDGDGSGNFMLSVSDCKLAHGVSNAQAVGALTRFNNYRVANGSTVGTIAWFPVYGGGNVAFDFKLAHVYAGQQHFGDSFQWAVDNQSYLVQADMLGGVVSCDVPRLYSGDTILNNMN